VITSPKYLAPLLIWQAPLAVGMAGSYLLFGRFNPEREYRNWNGNKAQLFGTKQSWKANQVTFDDLLRQAIADGLFANSNDVKTFFRKLEQNSEPSFDDAGALILKLKTTNEILGLTRDNILLHNSPLARQLLVAKLHAELQTKEKNRDTLLTFQTNQELLILLSRTN
jgi:hypothetical protein